MFSSDFLSVFTSSAIPNSSRISLSVSQPIGQWLGSYREFFLTVGGSAIVVDVCFKIPSRHLWKGQPCRYILVPLGWMDWPKNTPGERGTGWLHHTFRTVIAAKVPRGHVRGIAQEHILNNGGCWKSTCSSHHYSSTGLAFSGTA